MTAVSLSADRPMKAYEVQMSLPPEEGRAWRANKTVTAITGGGATRAIELALAKYPGADVHQVILRSHASEVILDG